MSITIQPEVNAYPAIKNLVQESGHRGARLYRAPDRTGTARGARGPTRDRRDREPGPVADRGPRHVQPTSTVGRGPRGFRSDPGINGGVRELGTLAFTSGAAGFGAGCTINQHSTRGGVSVVRVRLKPARVPKERSAASNVRGIEWWREQLTPQDADASFAASPRDPRPQDSQWYG